MSFMPETYQCTHCTAYFNVALGTFGYGMPKQCPYCNYPSKFFKHYAAGMWANDDGSLRDDNLLKWND